MRSGKSRWPCLLAVAALLGGAGWSVPARGEGVDDEATFDPHELHAYLGLRGFGYLDIDRIARRTEATSAHGGGFGVLLGLRTGPVLSFEGNWQVAFHRRTLDGAAGPLDGVAGPLDDAAGPLEVHLLSMLFTGDVKVNLPLGSAVEPFLQLGAGYGYVGAAERYGSGSSLFYGRGPAFVAGAGLELFTGASVSIVVRLMYRHIAFDKLSHDVFGSAHNQAFQGLLVDFALLGHL